MTDEYISLPMDWKDMYLSESNIHAQGSEYYVYAPTEMMKKAMYHPVRIGFGDFGAGYKLNRTALDNFCIAYIFTGSFHIRFSDVDEIARAGQFLLVDCYQPHQFSTHEPCTDMWLHFNGPSARAMYEYITGRVGNIINEDPQGQMLQSMRTIFNLLKSSKSILEPQLAHQIDTILCTCAMQPSSSKVRSSDVIDIAVSYISSHLDEELSLDFLSSFVALDKYYFVKKFKEHTGISPHQFILNARIEQAKYLLYISQISIQAISEACGFRYQSALCAAFKRSVGITPSQYRKSVQM